MWKALLTTYHLPGIFVGSFFFGETVVVAAAILAAHGFWSLFDVFVWSFAGTVSSDVVWFLFGRRLFQMLPRWSPDRTRRRKLLAHLDRVTEKRPLLALVVTKFIYGTRILTILYLSIRKIRLRSFFVVDSISTIVWLTVLLSIAWAAGGGTAALIPRIHEVGAALLAIVGTLILFKLFALWLGKKISQK